MDIKVGDVVLYVHKGENAKYQAFRFVPRGQFPVVVREVIGDRSVRVSPLNMSKSQVRTDYWQHVDRACLATYTEEDE